MLAAQSSQCVKSRLNKTRKEGQVSVGKVGDVNVCERFLEQVRDDGLARVDETG